MKNVLKTIAVLAASLLAFGACQGELENPREQVEATHSVTFVAGAPETKTEATVDGNVVNYSWTEGDEYSDNFHIFENGEPATSITPSLNDGIMTFTATFAGDRPTDAKYTGYYNDGIRTEQQSIETHYDQYSDVLVAKETSTYGEDGTIPFQFKRLGAIAEVTLKGLSGTKLLSVKIESLTEGVDLAGKFNGKEFVEKSKLITITCLNEIVSGNVTLRFVSLPVSGARLRFVVETLDDAGATHKYAKSFAEGASIDFSQGDLTPFSIGFGSQCEVSTTATFSVNGAEKSDVMATGEKINFPEVEESLSGFTFVGWTKTAIEGTQDTEPQLVDTANEVMGAESVTYYAVYAAKGGCPETTATLDAIGKDTTAGYKTGTKNDDKGNTWTYFASVNNLSGTLYFGLNTNASNYNIGSPKFAGNVSAISLKAYNGSSKDDRQFYFCSSNETAQPTSGDLASITVAKSEKFTTTYNVDLSSAPEFDQFYIYVKDALGISEIIVTYGGFTYSDYCTTVPEPATLSEIKVSGTPAEFWKGDEFNHNGITVTATWSDGNETDVTSSCDFTGYDMSTAGQQTVTVMYEDKTCTYTIEVKTIANTEATAYTVTEAKALINAGKDLGSEVYIKGKVSKVDNYNEEYKSITYWLDDNSFEVYGGLAKEDEEFTSIDDIKVGADVVVKGNIKKYNSTYELDKNNRLVSYTAPAAPKTTATISLSGNITSLQTDSQANVVTITYNGDGELSAQSSNTGVATVSLVGTTLTVTPVDEGSTTITVSAPETDNYTSVTKSYTLNVSAPAQPASLPFEFNDGKSKIDSTNGMSQSGLGSDYSASPKLKFDDAGDNLVINFNEAAKKVTYTIKGNSTDGTYAFDVMESADGVNYFTVHSHTSITDATTYTDDLASTSRFVKFVYTTKASGNVALGNIKITSASVSKYTLTINSPENGSITATVGDEEVENGASIEEGETVTIKAIPANTGYEFDSWSVTGATVGTSSIETFTMTGNVTVGATFKEKQGGGATAFEWNGGDKSSLTEMSGVTASGLGSDYAESNAPYRVKLDGTGDYIIIAVDFEIQSAQLKVKMLGGASTSSITIQESTAKDGTFTDVQTMTISGKQNDVLDFTTNNAFKSGSRVVKLYFTKGSNVGLGYIKITPKN